MTNRHYREDDSAAAVDAHVARALERIAKLEIEWPEDYLAASRDEAGER